MDADWDADASWIFHPSYDDTCNPGSIALFRREFVVSKLHTKFNIKVTADTRYRLFLNGRSISVGPCKGTPSAWHYESVDALSLLRIGRNVLAAQVLRYSPLYRGNISLSRTRKPGFILLAEGDEFVLPTDQVWRCIQDKSASFCADSSMDLFLSIDETVDGRVRHFDWTQTGFDDGAWLVPKIITNEFPGIELSELPWSLTPRSIPPLTEIPKRFKGVVAVQKGVDGIPDAVTSRRWTSMLQHQQPFVIPPSQAIEIDIEANEYSTGYLQFTFERGANAIFRHLCAESYELTSRDTSVQGGAKGDRTDFRNGFLNGEWNTYIVAGLDSETYEPFWFRAFRFIRIQIKTADEALIIKDISYRETNYPLEVGSKFSSPTSDKFSSFWDISLRTLKNCMHETYEDCPYYEQTQFLFDTRIQMLLTYNISSDDRLPRKALQDFRASTRPDGLLGMRCPSHVDIVLPVFSLFFPLMVHDHVRYFGDKRLAKTFCPTIDGILNFFDSKLNPLGLVSQFGRRWWSFVDWVDDWSMGTPHAARTGPGTYFSLVYALSLGAAAQVAEFVGRRDVAEDYAARKTEVIHAINKHCFDGKWYYDGPISSKAETPPAWLSQHCQVYAVLAGAIEGPRGKELMLRTMKDKSLHRMSLSQAFYLFRALEKMGLYELSSSMWTPWETMIKQGLDTWAETVDNPRSDCHAWSAAPLYEITSMILGIQPATPGFSVAHVRPSPNLLEEADGTVVTPKGPLRVRWKASAPAKAIVSSTRWIHLCVEAPAWIKVVLDVQGTLKPEVFRFEGTFEGHIQMRENVAS